MISGTLKLSELDSDNLAIVQEELSKLELYPKAEIDGIYGTKTQEAWTTFKQANHLDNIYLIGPASYSVLLIQGTKNSESKNIHNGELIDWNNPTCKISKYFTVREVTQGDKRRIPVIKKIQDNIIKLAFELDRVREAWGDPIVVTSWYRPPAVNCAVGGVSNSQHLTGSAADIYPLNGQLLKFQNWLDKEAWADKALGYGAKKGFVHLDLRKGRIRWVY